MFDKTIKAVAGAAGLAGAADATQAKVTTPPTPHVEHMSAKALDQLTKPRNPFAGPNEQGVSPFGVSHLQPERVEKEPTAKEAQEQLKAAQKKLDDVLGNTDPSKPKTKEQILLNNIIAGEKSLADWTKAEMDAEKARKALTPRPPGTPNSVITAADDAWAAARKNKALAGSNLNTLNRTLDTAGYEKLKEDFTTARAGVKTAREAFEAAQRREEK